VIKVALPSGEIEPLLTNLTEEYLPAAEAGELYFKQICTLQLLSGWSTSSLFNIELLAYPHSIKLKIDLKEIFSF